MTDIVKQLRIVELLKEAADEIDRLRAENKELRAKLEQAEIYISDAAEASER
jgi:hypothetical protein